MTFTVPSGATVAQLLELGSRSLLYFEHFGPRFERWAKRVPENGDYATLHRRFYEQNGLAEEAIRTTADALREVLDALRAQYQAQGDSTRGIAGVWQGSAATAAISLLNRQLTMAEADIAALTEISADFDRLPESLRAAVRGKAEIVAQILEHGTELKIDGKTPEDVDLIIDGADGFGWTHTLSAGSAASRAQELFPDMRLGVWEEFLFGGPGAVQSPWSPYQDVIAERCRSWLDELFVPDYERKVLWFGEICAVADDGVRDAYAGVVGKFGGLTGETYPRPGEAPVETVPSTPVETVPTSTVPAGTEPTSTTPSSTTPSSTTPTTTTPSTTPTTTTPTMTTPTTTTPSSTTPSSTTPSSTTPTTTTPTTTTPTTTTPSTTNSPTTSTTSPISTALDGLSTLSSAAQTLTPIAQSVAQSLGTGLSALTDSVTSGIDDALERVQQAFEPVDADGDGQPDDRVLAGFPLGEQRAEVALGADGQLTLTLTAGDGSSAEYRLESDEHGHPVLVQVDPETGEKIEPEGESQEESGADSDPRPGPGDPGESENPAPDDGGPPQPGSDGDPAQGEPAPASPAPGDPAATTPTPPAPAPADPAPASPAPPDPAPAPANPGAGIPGTPRREEDGEHRPQEFPDSAPADPPEPEHDSGARLSEAGPL